MTEFWQHLHSAQLKRQDGEMQIEQDEDPVTQQVLTLSLAGNTSFLGDLSSLPSMLVPEHYQQLWQDVQPQVERWLKHTRR